MTIPEYIKKNLERQAEYSSKINQLGRLFIRWCEKNNIDTHNQLFEDAHGYIMGDSSAEEMIAYLKRLK